jgi:hypothetical protein
MTGVSGSGAVLTPQPPPQRGGRGALVLLVLGLCIVAVLLLLLTDKVPPGIAALPEHLRCVAWQTAVEHRTISLYRMLCTTLGYSDWLDQGGGA